MARLAFTLYALISTTLMGICIVAALASGFFTASAIIMCVVVGAVLAVPVSWFVARALYQH